VNKRLYVGNLSYDTTEKDLSDLFSQVGSVTFTKIINNPDGKSKGFGFVEMSTEKEAQAAVEKFNQYELQGRTIKVNEANPQRTTGFTGHTGSGYRDRQRSGDRQSRGRDNYKKKYSSGSDYAKNDLNLKLRKLRKDLKDKLRKDK
jgi:RNA recognition motif-containing protein